MRLKHYDFYISFHLHLFQHSDGHNSNELVFDIEEYRAQSTNSKENTLGIPEETLEISPDQAKLLEIIPERCT